MTQGSDGHKFNDDLLIDEDDRNRATELYPTIFHVLDHPKLRDHFVAYDKPANMAKRRSRHAGLAALLLGAIALLGASAEPVYHDLNYSLPRLIAAMSALAGMLSVLVGLWGVMHTKSKREWLQKRLMTERLRQFHFQSFACRFSEIIASFGGEAAKEAYQRQRERWFQSFVAQYENKLGSEFARVVSDGVDAEVWVHSSSPAPATAIIPEQVGELFEAYRNLRIRHQLQYASYKLRDDAPLALAPKKQNNLFTTTSLLCILVLFAIHLLVALTASFNSNELVTNPWIHVIVVWLAICVLAVRALEEGLQPRREIERYGHYRSAVRDLLSRFDDEKHVAGKLQIMEEMERLSFEEMQDFFRTNNDARFVM